MRDQYAGDVSDLLKFALLRALAAHDRSLGVCWYYNPDHDGRPDGRHRDYLNDLKWRGLDPVLIDVLHRLPYPTAVSAIETLPIWPAATWFHRFPVPRPKQRTEWREKMRRDMERADIVFLDPDNGIGPPGPRHATCEEIALLRRPGRAIVLISFSGRQAKHVEQLSTWHRMLRHKTDGASIVTLRTSVQVRTALGRAVPRSRWFTVIDPDQVLIARACAFASKLDQIGKCSTSIDFAKENMSILSETPRDAILRLMGLLEKALATRTSRGIFREQLEANRAVFSDVSGISQARSVRNRIAHGELVPELQALQARAVLDQALSEVLRPQPEPHAIASRATYRESPRQGTMAAAAPVRARSIPRCTWVYFATDSAEDFAATKRIVTELGIIVRTVYNSAGIAIANTKQIRVGDSILLVHGGGDRGLAYRPMFSCEVIASEHPIPGFNGFSFVENRHIPQLQKSTYPRDPHFERYTGIAIRPLVDLDDSDTPIPRPRGNNAIRKWDEVF